MQRSKQQAVFFLLGAVLVGGVLGFSADRVMSAKKRQGPWVARTKLYEDLGIGVDQQKKMDSVLDEANCRVEELMKTVRPSMDSVKAEGRKDWLEMLTPAQRTALDAREARWKAQRDSADNARAAERAKDRPQGDRQDRPRRCGGPGMGPMGGPGGPPRRGPGGPFFHP